jgi:hypothetical protein
MTVTALQSSESHWDKQRKVSRTPQPTLTTLPLTLAWWVGTQKRTVRVIVSQVPFPSATPGV